VCVSDRVMQMPAAMPKSVSSNTKHANKVSMPIKQNANKISMPAANVKCHTIHKTRKHKCKMSAPGSNACRQQHKTDQQKTNKPNNTQPRDKLEH
jgi:hypothetical protein